MGLAQDWNGAVPTQNLQIIKDAKAKEFQLFLFQNGKKRKNYHSGLHTVFQHFRGHGVRSGFLDKQFLTQFEQKQCITSSYWTSDSGLSQFLALCLNIATRCILIQDP